MLGSWTSCTVGELLVEVVEVDGMEGMEGRLMMFGFGCIGAVGRRLMVEEVVTWEELLARMFMEFD